jgi:uroporphyrinogen-III synthase
MRILLTRPFADSDKLAGLLRLCGHDPLILPMLEIVPVAAALPMAPDLIILTSPRAMEALSADQRDSVLGIPTAVIGPTTGASALGPVLVDGQGVRAAMVRGIAALAPRAPLILSGQDERGDLQAELAAAGVVAERRVVYAAQPTLPVPVPDGLDWALLFSPRTAALFLERFSGDPAQLCLACLSDAVAHVVSARPGWQKLVVAETAATAPLLAAAGLLCEKAALFLSQEPLA